MADPPDMILPLLREMHAEMANGFLEVHRKLDAVDARFDRLEKRFDDLREVVNGKSVLGRYATAEVEGRLDAIEKRLEKVLAFEERLEALEKAS